MGASGAATGLALGWPAGLALLAFLPVIVWLHRQRRSGPVRVVPAIAPWLALAAAAPRRRRSVPPSVLLALHLAAAVLVALAAADPRRGGASPAAAARVVVLDTSASMAAEGRWSQALALARAQASQTGGPWSLVALGPEPWVPAARAAERGTYRAALASLAPGGVGGALEEALLLAAALAGPADPITVITDGTQPGTAPLPAGSRWLVVGRPVPNTAVVAARARAVAGERLLYARVSHFGRQAVEVPVRLLVDGVERDRRQVRLEGRASYETVWRLPAVGTWAEVRADAGDALPADDWAVVPLAARALDVQVIGASGPVWRALGAVPDLAARAVGPGSYRVDGSVPLTVVEGMALDVLPPGGLVLIGPPDTELLPAARHPGPRRVDSVADHPICRGLDMWGAGLAGAGETDLPPWATPILEAEGVVAAYAGTWRGTRVVVLAFDAAASELAERLAFPVFLGRALEWAARGPAPAVTTAGRSLDLGALPALVRGPEGTVRHVGGGALAASGPGRHEVWYGGAAADREPDWRLGVHAGDGMESDLDAAAASGEAPLAEEAPADRRPARGPNLLGPWLAALALVALLAEGVWRAGGVVGGSPRPPR